MGVVLRIRYFEVLFEMFGDLDYTSHELGILNRSKSEPCFFFIFSEPWKCQYTARSAREDLKIKSP